VFPWGKAIAGLATVAALVVAVRLLPVGAWLESFQTWVRGYGPWGYVLYAFVYAACTVLFVPGSLLTLGAGALFGVAAGGLVVLAGASLGAVAAFFLARTVLRKKVERMTAGNARFAALDRAMAKEGGKIVFLVRLAPVFPFNFINYAFGLTGVRPAAYTLATVVGMIPGIFAYVYLGQAGAQAASAASGTGGGARLLVNLVGAASALVVTVLVARIATKAIRDAGVQDGSSRGPEDQ
jgi:uncharacterized membrane protein YdjX (TVP38/TMEM64 family)